MGSEEAKITRRDYLKIVGGTIAGLVVGGVIGYLAKAPQVVEETVTTTVTTTVTGTPTTPTTTPPTTPSPPTTPTVVKTVRYLGHPFWLPEDAIKEFERTHPGVKIDYTYVDFYVVAQKQIADPASYDVGGIGRFRPHIIMKIPKAIPIEKTPRVNENYLADVLIHPERFWSEAVANRFKELFWAEEGKAVWIVPNMMGWEDRTYLPEFIPYEELGNEPSIPWDEFFNPEWKGRVATIDEGFDGFSRVANYLDYHKKMTFSGSVSNLTKEEVDAVYEWLLPIIKSGQIKCFWSKYGDIVAMMSSREIWQAVTWVPVSLDCRAAGVPAFHALPPEGPCYWWNGSFLSKYMNPDVYEESIMLANYHLELTIAKCYAKQLYINCGYKMPELKKAMGDEFYEWFHNGKPTYEPIEECTKICWPDNPDFWELEPRLQKALFLPTKYFEFFWTGAPPRTGKPHPRGKIRDMGSIDAKQKYTRWFLSPDLPDNNDYYVEKWEALKAQLPA